MLIHATQYQAESDRFFGHFCAGKSPVLETILAAEIWALVAEVHLFTG
jgi:hypothetical protein